jgi:Ca-activated chloride channel family protein
MARRAATGGTTGRRLLLAIDVSGSMAARDMAGRASRLQVVKDLAGEFIQRRHGGQVG